MTTPTPVRSWEREPQVAGEADPGSDLTRAMHRLATAIDLDNLPDPTSITYNTTGRVSARVLVNDGPDLEAWTVACSASEQALGEVETTTVDDGRAHCQRPCMIDGVEFTLVWIAA